MRQDVWVELVLHDRDVLTWLTAADAVRWAGEAVDAHHRGELVAPARIHADFGNSRMVFTTGHLREPWFGYRSYDTFPAGPGMLPSSGRAAGRTLGARARGAAGHRPDASCGLPGISGESRGAGRCR